jgi:hypothetical protein
MGRTEGSPGIHMPWHRKDSVTGTLDAIYSTKKNSFKTPNSVSHGSTGVSPVL